MIRVAIAEDHNALIDGIKLLLDKEDDMQFVGYANNGEVLFEVVANTEPDVVITDIRMPVMDGIMATQQLMRAYPHIKVIAFTMFDQTEAVQQMLNAGARGYLLKNSSLQELLLAIRTVHAGKTYYDANLMVSTETQRKPHRGPLSKRQIEILKLIASGSTNQEIADQLFIGKTTVETHRKNMIRILNLKGPGELLRYAIESKYDFGS